VTTESVLDDYLEQLLGDALPSELPAATVMPAAVEAVETDVAVDAFAEAALVTVPPVEADAIPALLADAPQVQALVNATSVEAPPSNEREPSWDDLPDEVIYETSAEHGAQLANADSTALQAAFEAAAVGEAQSATSPQAAIAASAAPAALAPRHTVPPSSAAAPARATTWQDLQAEAQQAPASSGRQQLRRATERSSRWLRLRCGVQAYALELLKVQEVVLPVPLLSLRGTAPAMLGIMNLRGQVVPVLDLGLHLGAAATVTDSQTRIVVLEENGDIMGLRVSAVDDVTNLADSQIESPDTARICRISNDVFRGVARLQQQPIILLDAARLLSGA